MKQINVHDWYDTLPANRDYKEDDIKSFFDLAVKELKENFMFMHIQKDEDGIPHLYFKHCDTRRYIKFPVSFNDAFLNYPIS